MKWVDLESTTELLPFAVLRLKDDSRRFFGMDINSTRGTGEDAEWHVDTYNWQEWVKVSDMEWLDESSPSAEDAFEAARVMETEPFSGLEIAYLFNSFEDYLKCLEQ